LCATVVGGRAPQRWLDFAFLVEAWAQRQWWSGRLSIGVAGAGRQGPVVGRLGGRAAGEDRWAGGVTREPVRSAAGRRGT
jgi:hypothetical protein